MKRILKEFDKVGQKIDVEIVNNNIAHWQLAFHGPSETPYFGGTFLLEIVFPDDYPFRPPKVVFKTRIYHPNIDKNGNICLEILGDGWAAKETIEKVLESIVAILKQPNYKDAVRPEVAKLFVENREEYMRKARYWTDKLAN